MKTVIFAACLLVALASCNGSGNAGTTADTAVNGNADAVNKGMNNSGGSGMTGPTTGTMQSADTAMKQRINTGNDSVR